jgi:hypothetical protein
MSDNVLYGLKSNAWTLYVYSLNNLLSSDENYFFHPYVSQHIAYGPSWTRRTFAEWQTLSGKDAHSKTNWFTQPAGEASRATAFYNTSKAPLVIDLGSRQYLDLDQTPVMGSLTLQPFTSRILVDNGPAALALLSIQPSLYDVTQPADFDLTVIGAGFTANSVVRWDGSDRPTAFVNSARLTAAIDAADVNTIGDYLVTVWDPNPAPGGTETAAKTFHVAATLYGLNLPLVRR